MSILEKRRPGHCDIVFTGGEVTSRKDFLDLVRCAKQAGYRNIQIQSNGRMFYYEAFCKQTIDAGANEFVLALHGSKKEIHDSLTGSKGSFEQTSAGISNLIRSGQRVVVNTVINKLNYKDLPDIARLSVSLSVPRFQFAFMHINRIIKNDSVLIGKIVPRKSLVVDYVKKGLQIGIDNDIYVSVEAIPYCLLSGYEKYVAEPQTPPSSVEGEVYIENFNEFRKQKGRMKGPLCVSCKFNVQCEGPWREYPEIFGWDEFIPVKG